MKALAFLVFALLCAVPGTVVAGDVPDSQTLRDRSDAAYGPVPDAYRQVIEFTGTSSSGTRVIFRRGTDRREVLDAGPIHTEFGTNAGQHWHENANGHVVIDEADPGLATQDRFTTTVTRTTEPMDAFVIATLNAKGFGTREFIDAKTSYLIRRESLTPTGKVTTVYDDFRPFGTRRLAGHWTTHDETSGTDTQYVNREFVAGDVSANDVAIPSIKRPLVEFPAGVNSVELPSVFEPSGHVVVRLAINGRGLDLLLDSGAGNILIDTAVARQLGLTELQKKESSANAGRVATALAIVPQITIGNLQMHDTVVSIAPWASEEPGVKTVGLFGFDFLCESGITIDYEHKRVIAERYGTYGTPQDPRTIALSARLGNQVPLITGDINGAIAERIMIDTGAVGPFLLFDYFERRHPEALPRSTEYAQSVMFSGVGGRFETKSVQLDAFMLGNVKFAKFTGYRVVSGKSYSFDSDGVIGPDFLRFFDVHLDYPNGMIYLVPNATGRKSMH